MSNQYGGGNKNPPWARQEFSNQNAGMIPANVSYPYNHAQTQFAQQQMGAGGTNLQGNTAGNLLPQPGLALPSSLSGNTSQVGAVSYPVKTQNSAAGSNNQQKPRQRIFTGSVTKMHDNFGFVDEEVFFQVSCVKGMIPKVGDRVLVEASYNASMPFKWNATRVLSLSEAMGNSQIMALQQQQQQQQQQHQQQQQQQQQQLKAIQQQAIGLMGASGLIGSLGAGALSGGAGLLSNPPGPPPLMGGLNKFQNTNMFNSGNRSGINTGPGLLGDPSPRALLAAAAKGVSSVGMGMSDNQKDRDRRDRDRRDRRDFRRKRSRSPPTKGSGSPPPRSRTSPKRKARPLPRYMCQVPKFQLDVQDANVISLKSKYSNLYIPSDFFHASYSWVENFPLTRPFSLGQACSYHIMHKDVPQIGVDTAVLEPHDADHLFSAKVMLLASPHEEELYKKSCCLAEDLPDAMQDSQHPTRLIQFLVGTRGKNEPMAIGGPWSPSLDGPNPHANPLVLIKTAVRTTKALTGIDLSNCTQWYRFAEIRYFRPESKHKDRVQPARVETVVLFLPDVWTCSPTRLEWDSLQTAYHKHLQQRLNPEAAQQQEEEENEEEPTEAKPEPSHYSALDPKTMKVGDLRHELELRGISLKGLKSQLVARLAKVLKTEEEKEQENKESEAEKAAKEELVKEEEEMEQSEEEEEKTEAQKQEVRLRNVNEQFLKYVEEEEKTETQRLEEEEQQRKEKRERAFLERKYKLPETPSIIVHPSATAKGGKFECTLLSLSVLLDYRPEDNKEHSFEVSLFAELFNEMLIRDFGFQVYKCIAAAPIPKKEEEKKKDEKKDRDEKKDEKKDKDEKKEEKKDRDDKKDDRKEEKKDKEKKEKEDRKKTDEPSPKRKRSSEKDEKGADNDSMTGDRDDENDDKEDEEKKDKDNKKKKKDGEQTKTTKPSLLLAFSYFDQNHCGYLTDKDTEDIIHTLGLKLSRAQVKKIVQKVLLQGSSQVFKYRKLTDQIVGEDGKPVESEQDESIKMDPEQLARGNKESLRKLLQLSGVKTEGATSNNGACAEGAKEENPNFVYYKGSFLDIESLMQRLERSEKSRTALEKNMTDLTDQLKGVKGNLQEQTSLSSKLQGDVRSLRSDLDRERKLCHSAELLNKDWLRAAEHSKSQMQGALNGITAMINKDLRKSEGSKKEAKKEAEEKKEADEKKKEVEEKKKESGEKDTKSADIKEES